MEGRALGPRGNLITGGVAGGDPHLDKAAHPHSVGLGNGARSAVGAQQVGLPHVQGVDELGAVTRKAGIGGQLGKWCPQEVEDGLLVVVGCAVGEVAVSPKLLQRVNEIGSEPWMLEVTRHQIRLPSDRVSGDAESSWGEVLDVHRWLLLCATTSWAKVLPASSQASKASWIMTFVSSM